MSKETCIRTFADQNQIQDCQKKVNDNEALFTQLSHILSLAGNDVRLKILFLLEEENELCPCDLADILNMSVPAISQHLRKMKDGRILETRRVGQTIFYSLNETNLKLLKPLFQHISQSIKKEKL